MSDQASSSDSFPTPGRVAPRPLTREEREKNVTRLRQVTQRFFTKAALTIISSRINLPPSFFPDSHRIREERWFNLILDESDDLQKELSTWDRSDTVRKNPPPLIIDIYLDTKELARNQKLVIIDERGRRWDACEALSSPASSTTNTRIHRTKPTRVILERWKISIANPTSESEQLQGEPMANMYKKAVILFRSLYTNARLLPAWSFTQKIAKQPATLTSLRPLYHITSDNTQTFTKDLLTKPLYPSPHSTTTAYAFHPVSTPAGDLSIKFEYRTNCKFQVEDADALISSHFTGMDNQRARTSHGELDSDDPPYGGRDKEPGSLPMEKRRYGNTKDLGQAYGSMSTFHNAEGAPSTSPMTALRDAAAAQSASPSESPSVRPPPFHRSSQSSRSSMKSTETPPSFPRRPSVSFQPFKAGSLSSSPAPMTNMGPPPSPGTSAPRTSSIATGLAHARNPSLSSRPSTAGRRTSVASNEIPVVPPSPNSPKPPPVNRYSSSFSNRRSRFSSGGSNPKNEEENSSGKASHTSSNQPGSGLLTEPEGGSSGSVNADDDNISDFLKLLEAKKDLKSFNRTDEASRDASTRKTAAQLSKFRGLRDSHAALSDSMSSSTVLNRSSSSSSRQLSSVPPALAGASVSTSSSPGKPISPHTPHTPAIPSRLSATAISVGQADALREENTTEPLNTQEEDDSETPIRQTHGSSAIDIPIGPQRYQHSRRPSSYTQRQRVQDDDYSLRSASVPSDDHERDRDRPDLNLNLNELLTMHEPVRGAAAAATTVSSTHHHHQQAVPPISTHSLRSHRRANSSLNTNAPNPDDTDSPSPSTTNAPDPSSSNSAQQRLLRSRLSRASGTTTTPSRGGSVSSFGAGSASAERDRARRFSSSASANRPGVSNQDDDEPLLFTMSELEQQSRRSVEDGRGDAPR